MEPQNGIEPSPPPWQGGVLTIILLRQVAGAVGLEPTPTGLEAVVDGFEDRCAAITPSP